MQIDAELTPGQKAARRRRTMLAVGLLVLLCGMPPLVNSMSNPRLAGLHGSDVVQLVALGSLLGVGLSLLVGGIILRGE